MRPRFLRRTPNLKGTAVTVSSVGSTTTRSGIRVRTEIDPATYPSGVVISDEHVSSLNVEPRVFHGD